MENGESLGASQQILHKGKNKARKNINESLKTCPYYIPLRIWEDLQALNLRLCNGRSVQLRRLRKVVTQFYTDLALASHSTLVTELTQTHLSDK